jgi:membrane protease YdiL (CAAX protease family)
MDANRSNDISSYLDWSNRGRASLWRYVVGTILILFVFFFLSGFGQFPILLLVPNYKSSRILSVIATLLVFAIAFFALPPIVRLIHARPYWSVAMPRPRFERWNFWAGFVSGIAVGLVCALIFSLAGVMPIESNPEFDVGTWLVLAVVGFAGIFIQAGSEELLFRGYLTQFTRRFTANPLLFIGIPALLFALPHIANIAALGGGLLVMTPYLIAGVLYAWVAYKTGSLWMALGLHLANNYSGLALVGTKGDILPTAAPFQVNVPSLPVVSLAVAVQTLIIMVVVNYLLARRQHRYAGLASRAVDSPS